jgi:hypothetical protein
MGLHKTKLNSRDPSIIPNARYLVSMDHEFWISEVSMLIYFSGPISPITRRKQLYGHPFYSGVKVRSFLAHTHDTISRFLGLRHTWTKILLILIPILRVRVVHTVQIHG